MVDAVVDRIAPVEHHAVEGRMRAEAHWQVGRDSRPSASASTASAACNLMTDFERRVSPEA